MGLFNGIKTFFNSEFDVRIEPRNKALFADKAEVIRYVKEADKRNQMLLTKTYDEEEIKTPLDEYYYDELPIPQKYVIDVLPEKRYDYVFNSIDGTYTLGITCFGRQHIAGYDLDVCEVVHIDNVNNVITVLENVMGLLDRQRLKSTHEQNIDYVEIFITKAFAPERLDKIIVENKGHFGMVRFNEQKNKFQVCSISPVLNKLNQIYINSIEKRDVISLVSTNLN